MPHASDVALQSQVRTMTMAAMAHSKREGDISSAFVSLSGAQREPLPRRFLDLKRSLVAGHERAVVASWERLLRTLKTEIATIAAARDRSAVVPVLDFATLDVDLARCRGELRKRGCAMIRGVIARDEARGYKDEVEAYVAANPGKTKAFPQHDPQVWELYWSAPQLRARTHPNMLQVQRALMQGLWHAARDGGGSDAVVVDLARPLSYADRLRIRRPGDASFALGPHMDGGSVERWEREGYGDVYGGVFAGGWDDDAEFDAFEAGGRARASMDNYQGAGSCSMFRAFQGWLSMSSTGPGEGTLSVYPLVKEAAAYVLLRPFFRPVKERGEFGEGAKDEFLAPENWTFTAGEDMTSELQGATPGHGQEIRDEWHPHLELDRAMVSMPKVEPGDYVVWHCDCKSDQAAIPCRRDAKLT